MIGLLYCKHKYSWAEPVRHLDDGDGSPACGVYHKGNWIKEKGDLSHITCNKCKLMMRAYHVGKAS